MSLTIQKGEEGKNCWRKERKKSYRLLLRNILTLLNQLVQGLLLKNMTWIVVVLLLEMKWQN